MEFDLLGHSDNQQQHQFVQMQRQQQQQQYCNICKVTENLLRCSKCKMIYYCSAKHQEDDWSNHKKDCKKFRKNKELQKQQQQQQQQQQYQQQQQQQICTNYQKFNQNQWPGDSEQLIDSINNAGDSTNLTLNELNETSSNNQILDINNINNHVILNNKQLILQNNIISNNYQNHHNMQQQSQYLELNQNQENLIKNSTTNNSNHIENNSINNCIDEKCLSLEINNGSEKRYEDLCRNIINDMNLYGLSVVDDFLGLDKGLQILNEVHKMYAGGGFRDGQLVSNNIAEKDSRTIRGDKITWVKGTESNSTNIGYLINQIDAVICRAGTMKDNGLLGKYKIRERTKGMIAVYPSEGSHYVTHVDNPNKDGRIITAIYYLNVNWDAKRSGGLLRIFPENNSVADIEPKFDRLIFFWSDRRNPHEVQPAHRTRYAITVWYFDANEREAARNRYKPIHSSNST